MKALLLVLSSIFFASVAISQPELSPSGVEKIKILSWNIYMLPGLLAPGKIPRADAIGNLLANSDYDVIVFQEAFHKRSRNTLSRLLSPAFPFQEGPANQKLFSVKTNSGLWIFSKYPITEMHSIIYNTRHGWDAFSRKGALLIEISVNGSPLQIIGTHLQNAGVEWRRQSQCAELFDRLLRKYEKPGIPQIVCGDFNIEKYGEQKNYDQMLQTLDASDGEVSSDRKFSFDCVSNDLQPEGKQQNLIDYILVRPNQSMIRTSDRRIQAHQKQWHIAHKDLSDHYSIETEIHYQGHAGFYTVSAPGSR
ncbi:sphingomyelinase C [soil metagenome]